MPVTIAALTNFAAQAGPDLLASVLDTALAAIRSPITGLVPLVTELPNARDYTGRQGWAKGADIASAAALTIGTDGNYFDVTGVVTITSISTAVAGTIIALQFDGALTLTHNATTLILNGAINVTTVAGDVFLLMSEGGGNWREIARSRRLLAKGTVRKTTDFTTASATLVSVTDLTITLTTGARRVLLTATLGRLAFDTTAVEAAFAFAVAGVDTDELGMFRAQTSVSERNMVTITYLTDVLAAGSNTFLVRARSNGVATVTIGAATQRAIFSAIEIASP